MPTEPGWYLDPNTGQHRYWNGTSWAARTAEEQSEASEAAEHSDTTTTD